MQSKVFSAAIFAGRRRLANYDRDFACPHSRVTNAHLTDAVYYSSMLRSELWVHHTTGRISGGSRTAARSDPTRCARHGRGALRGMYDWSGGAIRLRPGIAVNSSWRRPLTGSETSAKTSWRKPTKIASSSYDRANSWTAEASSRSPSVRQRDSVGCRLGRHCGDCPKRWQRRRVLLRRRTRWSDRGRARLRRRHPDRCLSSRCAEVRLIDCSTWFASSSQTHLHVGDWEQPGMIDIADSPDGCLRPPANLLDAHPDHLLRESATQPCFCRARSRSCE